ncbi:MAG: FMN-binding protein [Halanaerobiaceae bacterium]
MKKLFVAVLALAFVVSFSVAGMADGHLEDGEYVGYSEANDKGYVEAHVTIEDEEIVDVELVEYRDTGVKKDDSYDWDEWHEAMDELPGRFEEANSAEIDVFSGATGTSEKAMGAVEMALAKAEGQTEFDGTFLGVSDFSDRGGRGLAWVTIEEGEIVEVKLEELQDEDGELVYKDEDYSYDAYFEAKDEMPARFEEANSADVDVYSGATSSSDMWSEAVAEALSKAGL